LAEPAVLRSLRFESKRQRHNHRSLGNGRLILEQAFSALPKRFPQSILDRFISETGVSRVARKYSASGTEIIKDLGEEHVKSGKPIVYSLAIQSFQIAAHEEIIPLARLYEICEISPRLLDGKHKVGRVIARPFLGEPGKFYRTENRHD